jgi:hypothetical protein
MRLIRIMGPSLEMPDVASRRQIREPTEIGFNGLLPAGN